MQVEGCQGWWTLQLPRSRGLPSPNAVPPPTFADPCLLELLQHVLHHRSCCDCGQDRELSCSWYLPLPVSSESGWRTDVVRQEDTRSSTGGSGSRSTTLPPSAKPLSFLRGALSRTRIMMMVNPERSCPTVSRPSAELSYFLSIDSSPCFGQLSTSKVCVHLPRARYRVRRH